MPFPLKLLSFERKIKQWRFFVLEFNSMPFLFHSFFLRTLKASPRSGKKAKTGPAAPKPGSGSTTPESSVNNRKNLRRALTPGKTSPPSSRKRKNNPNDLPNSSPHPEVRPKVKKALEMPTDVASASQVDVAELTSSAAKAREFSTPAKPDVPVSLAAHHHHRVAPPSTGQLPDFSVMDLNAVTPWRSLDEATHHPGGIVHSSDVLETPRVEFRR
jgi:hypothetical protein